MSPHISAMDQPGLTQSGRRFDSGSADHGDVYAVPPCMVMLLKTYAPRHKRAQAVCTPSPSAILEAIYMHPSGAVFLQFFPSRPRGSEPCGCTTGFLPGLGFMRHPHNAPGRKRGRRLSRSPRAIPVGQHGRRSSEAEQRPRTAVRHGFESRPSLHLP